MMIIFIFLMFSIFLMNLINNKFKFMFYQNMLFMMLFIFYIYNNIMFFSLKIFMFFFIDYYSFNLIMLLLWIMGLMLMSKINFNFMNLYLLNLLILFIMLMLTFMSINYFMFYFFFEISMVPTLILIIGWGFQYERIEAGVYMFMYTLFSSLPMLIVLLKIYMMYDILDMIIVMNMNLINNLYMYIYLLFSFLVKLPMFFFHLWLPKAHVEAPISGSMILAGVMLKLGSYGILRIMLMMEEICIYYNYLIMSLGLMGSLFVSIICLKQFDMKMLIAYSSVVHMGLMLCSLMTLSFWGYMGGLLMMISHGLCSSGLFCLVNINYERLKSRSIFINKGMMNILPSISLFWFLMSIFNMSSPPSLNLFSELIMINSIMMWSSLMLLNLMLMSFMSVLYMMLFYSSIQHGEMYFMMNNFIMVNKREYLLIILHLIPLLFLILML
uniref:NADH-ubiquinone oxidoreductase chain 4 n=1 Tax=Saphonecrus sp. ZJUH 20220015 TaxID=2943460 RepID=A0A9E8K326_9HYME|nr:NADH dehydrogenase subunit 4 [Saphonecrus sp. ZJUH 20220015]